jgi:hypothetical protein
MDTVRRCQCGADISSRHGKAIYCDACALIAIRQARKDYKQRVAARKVVPEITDRLGTSTPHPLSPDIERLLASGKRGPEIARELGLNYWQVRRVELRLRRRSAEYLAVGESTIPHYEDDPRAIVSWH